MKKFGCYAAALGLIFLVVSGFILYRTGIVNLYSRWSLNTTIDVKARDRFGNTALMNAVVAEHPDEVKALLADPNVVVNALAGNFDKDPILVLACVNADIAGKMDAGLEIIKLLVEAGADVNRPSSVGLRPIHATVRIETLTKRIKAIKILVEGGAHINSTAVDGGTLLHIAVTMNVPIFIRMLVDEFGQIINFDKKQIFNFDRDMTKRYTPLELARRMGKVGADSAEEVLLKKPKLLGADGNVEAKDCQGRDPLMLALLRDDRAMVDEMMNLMKKKGKSLSQVASNGRTTLMCAVMSDEPVHYTRKLLADPSIKASINQQDNEGNTALLWVIVCEHPSERIEIANFLKEAGANLKIKNKKGRDLHFLAKRLNDESLVNWCNANIH